MDSFLNQTSQLINENKRIFNEMIDLKSEKSELLVKNKDLELMNSKLNKELYYLKTTIRKMKVDLEKQSKAIAVYIKISDEKKRNIEKEKSELFSDLKESVKCLEEQKLLNESIEKELNELKAEKESFGRTLIEEKNSLRLECQKGIDRFRAENEELKRNNYILNEKLNNIRKIDTNLTDLKVKQLYELVEKQNLVKAQLTKSYKKKEDQFKHDINSLRARGEYFKKQNELSKKQYISSQYKNIANRSLYSSSIRKLTKFGVKNNDDVFDELTQVVEKMRQNSSKHIMENSAKAIVEIRDESIKIQANADKIKEKRSDERVKCALCLSDFTRTGYLKHHMRAIHAIKIDETARDIEVVDLDSE